jgi:predicted acylesterase/phospholipase RssA
VDSASSGNSNNRKTALILSAGGGRGAFECGAVEALMKLAQDDTDFQKYVGWPPKVLVGTSIGATNAAVLACRDFHQQPKTQEGLLNMWEALGKRECTMHSLPFRKEPTGKGFCLFGREPWKDTLDRYASDAELKTLASDLKLFLVAFNVSDGVPVIYTNDVGTAQLLAQSSHKDRVYKVLDPAQGQHFSYLHVMASSAIPYVYRRVEIPPPCAQEGVANKDIIKHWDGALMYTTPLEPAIKAKATHIIIILLTPLQIDFSPPTEPVIRTKPDLPKVGWPLRRASQLLDLATIATFIDDWDEMIQEINANPGAGPRCMLIYPKDWLKMLDLIKYGKRQISSLRKEGYAATYAAWNRIKKRKYWDSGSLHPV